MFLKGQQKKGFPERE